MEHFLLPPAGLVRAKRDQQIQFAHIVDNACREKGIYIVQAPTGTGKTFGYGVPIFASTKQAVLTTAKKNLQQQLFEKDLPRLKEHVSPREFAYLKGRSNYLCEARYNDFKGKASGYDKAKIESIQGYVDQGVVDLETFNVPFKSSISVIECLKASCPYKSNCGYLSTREKFIKAPVRVANHAMVAQEVVMGKGILLGEYDVLVLDEAHLFAGFVRGAMSFEFNSDVPDRLQRIVDGVYGVAFNREMFRLSQDLFGELQFQSEGAFNANNPIVRARIKDISEVINGMREEIFPYIEKYFNLETLNADVSKVMSAGTNAEEVSEVIRAIFANNELTKASDALARISGLNPYARRIEQLVSRGLMSKETAAEALELRIANELEYVSHVVKGDSPQLKLEPVDVGLPIRRFLQTVPTVIITSATLMTGGSFGYTLYSFGLSKEDVKECVALPPTFDYATQAVLYVEDKLPHYPKFEGGRAAKDEYFKGVGERANELCTASAGGAFILVPAWDDVYRIREVMAPMQNGANYRLMIQGRGDSVNRVVDAFKSRMDNVVIATKSLWEGVDLPGAVLRLVIVTRMPYLAEGNAVYQRQKANLISKLMEEGKTEAQAQFEAFLKISVMHACTELGQGMGRLIRTETDRGLIALLDSRVGIKSRTSYKALVHKTFPMKPMNDPEFAKQYLQIIRPKALRS